MALVREFGLEIVPAAVGTDHSMVAFDSSTKAPPVMFIGVEPSKHTEKSGPIASISGSSLTERLPGFDIICEQLPPGLLITTS